MIIRLLLLSIIILDGAQQCRMLVSEEKLGGHARHGKNRKSGTKGGLAQAATHRQAMKQAGNHRPCTKQACQPMARGWGHPGLDPVIAPCLSPVAWLIYLGPLGRWAYRGVLLADWLGAPSHFPDGSCVGCGTVGITNSQVGAGEKLAPRLDSHRNSLLCYVSLLLSLLSWLC